MKKWPLFLFSFSLIAALFSEEPIENNKIENSFEEEGEEVNKKLSSLKEKIKKGFAKASELQKKQADATEYKTVLQEIKSCQAEVRKTEEQWRSKAAQEGGDEDDVALWDIGETTLSQLIMEYGAADFLYVIPQELSGMKISLFSSIPLPRESWNEMIELILIHNGVGIKRLNPYAKQLYILKLDPSAIEGVVDREENLELFASYARIFYVLSPPSEQMKSIQAFFERFSDPKQTTVQSVGSKVVIVSTRETVEKLLSLYHAVWEKEGGKTVKTVNLTKISPQEAEKVVKAVFSDSPNKGRPTFYPSAVDELVILPLPQGLVFVGEKETVERGAKILSNLEAQLEDPGEKVIYWYTCKHSTPEDIAEVLDKVYDSLIGSSFEKGGSASSFTIAAPSPVPSQELPQTGQTFPQETQSTAFNPVLPATAPFVQPGILDKDRKTSFGNFVVDAKTNSILMVVRREELSKIKTLLKKLDVPKKMVQLDVLLVEKRLTDRKQVGFNILEIGKNSSGEKETAMSFDTNNLAVNKGILSFMFSRNGGKAPPMNITYNFLLAQDDVRINANPSVITVNQTPASVSIVEEISINNGAIKLDTTGGVTVEQSYTRAQYGITINLTPTIHLADEDKEERGFVTLQTNLEFDTTQAVANDRPPVTRRHIENEVCIADGETVVLGGLRRKIEEESREKIPFLGDLPGLGKLFGATKSTDTNTEMFIFITPHIIKDPVDDLRKVREAECQKRLGDLPEFLEKIGEAKSKEKKRLFANSIKMLWDMY